MATFSADVWCMNPGLTLELMDMAEFKPCAVGQEGSLGFQKIHAGFHWFSGGQAWQFFDWLHESRKVPKKWLDAELHRRTLPTMSPLQISDLREVIKQELWRKLAPEHTAGFVAYHRESGLLVVQAASRMARSIMHALVGSLKNKGDDIGATDRPYNPVAFDGLIRAMIRDEVEDSGLEIGSNVEFAEGSGGRRKLISFRNYDKLVGDEHVAQVMLTCKMVATCGLIIDGIKEGEDDFKVSPYGSMTVTEIKEKGASQRATDLLRADRVLRIVQAIQEASAPYIPVGEEIDHGA